MSAKLYRKKQIVIDAIEWTGTNNEEIREFMGVEYLRYPVATMGIITIATHEGNMEAGIGDYIIKEPFDKERKFYPCKPDIFEKTYEEVEN